MSGSPSLLINEIFFSIQGESTLVGTPTVFVRTTGCNIRCTYCDTKYSYYEGTRLTFEKILEKIKSYDCKTICVTGGEPMAQPSVIEFTKLLCDTGYVVSVETNGHFDTEKLDSRVLRIIDVKTPGSGEEKSFNKENLKSIRATDQFKFVICNSDDYDWSSQFVKHHQLSKKCTVLFSPSFNDITPQWLSERILSDRLDVRLQLQIHKYIWNPDTRGV
ncbi:MAG: radical SAM protein [Oligoflexia bacterium]|nr:radical SAM protein [Oligoflexia bacterium]